MLDRLRSAFTVGHIMTPTENLRRADEWQDAANLLLEFDVVPYPRRGPISGFFRRNTEELHSLLPMHLLSEGTGIIELPSLLLESPFYFVFASREVAGYVHYSDLNKADAKVPFFALYQGLERHLWDAASGRITPAVLEQLFTSKQVRAFAGRRRRVQASNVEVGWSGVFSFPQIITIARRFGLTDLTDAEIDLLREIRNRVAHSQRNLVESYDEVAQLAEACRLFRRRFG